MHQGELTSWKAQENTFYTKQTNKTNTQQSELTADWHRLLQEIVESPPRGIQSHLDMILSNLQGAWTR